MVFPNCSAWFSCYRLTDVCIVYCLPCRLSHTEQRERADHSPPPTSVHVFPALPPHPHNTTEFPTPPPTPPGGHRAEALPTPPSSPHFPPPPSALASPPVPSAYLVEHPATTSCHPRLRYDLCRAVALPELVD